jgi:hypothetical protein
MAHCIRIKESWLARQGLLCPPQVDGCLEDVLPVDGERFTFAPDKLGLRAGVQFSMSNWEFVATVWLYQSLVAINLWRSFIDLNSSALAEFSSTTSTLASCKLIILLSRFLCTDSFWWQDSRS